MSTGAQRGGITFGNAILAVLLGPWSEILPPNAHAISSWNVEHTLFAICLTALLGFTVAGSWFAKRRWLRYSSTGVSVLALVGWVLAGLLKVATELT
ncbi:MAG: hypothetical protein RBU21_14365 [FCB group bacterium]|nr:hypothetical protein [FCB group bacterium]